MKSEHIMAAKALGGHTGVVSEPDSGGKIHAMSIHPHKGGFKVHHHHLPPGHPKHNHIAHVTAHHIEDADALAEHIKEHAPTMHMPEGGAGGDEEALG